MEFKSLKNIETSFRQIRLFGIVFLCLCALVSVFSVVASFRFAEKQREKIYVLDGGKSLMLALSHKELLTNTKLKLNQIAELAGYSDAKYMSRVFKDEVGVLPSEFRKSAHC